jgi:hypothetical protein
MNTTDNPDGFRFLLSVDHKENVHSKKFDWVSNLLRLEPTEGHQIGDKKPWNKEAGFDRWSWGYGSQWFPFGEGFEFSKALYQFLQSLPPEDEVWQELSKYCEYSLYIPIEREHFQIEFDFEPIIWDELRKRKLHVEISTLSKPSKDE